MKELKCLRCGGEMAYLMRETFQKGDSGAWVGNLSFHFRGGFEMEVYSCKTCGRLEFFLPRRAEEPEAVSFEEILVEQGCESMDADGMPQVRCPACGRRHDFDYPRCPNCGHDYNAK